MMIEEITALLKQFDMPEDIAKKVISEAERELESTGTISMSLISDIVKVYQEKSRLPMTVADPDKLMMQDIRMLTVDEAKSFMKQLQYLQKDLMQYQHHKLQITTENLAIQERNHQRDLVIEQRRNYLAQYNNLKSQLKYTRELLEAEESMFFLFRNRYKIEVYEDRIDALKSQMREIKEKALELKITKKESLKTPNEAGYKALRDNHKEKR